MVNIDKHFTESKFGIESLNEDGIFISEDFIAVIDGATSKTNKLYKGLTGGQVVRNIIIDYLSKMSGNKSFHTTALEIQHYIEQEFPADRYFPASASAAIYNVRSKEVWLVGDCQALINNKMYCNKKKVDMILSEARSLAMNALIAGGMTEDELMVRDEGRKLILPFLKLQSKFENRIGPYGFLVFNNQFMEEAILEKEGLIIPVPDHSTVVLASDGYPFLSESFEESENRLAELLCKDPLCYKQNKSTKGLKSNARSFDDRSFLKFTTVD